MNAIRSIAAHVVAAALVALSCSAAYAVPTTQLYVSNPFPTGLDLQSQGKVTIFDPAASGPTSPLRTINQPAGAWTLALDSGGRLYSQYFVGENPTYIYNPTASGNDTPIFIAHGAIISTGTAIADATGIAVDSQGYFYKVAGAGSVSDAYLEGYAPNTTSPFSLIPLNNSEKKLTVDGNDNVIVASVNSLLVYAPRLAGGTPIRTISSPFANADKITYSKFTGNIYTAAGGAAGASRVSVFDGNASGNATPLRTITGTATGMKQFVTGLAINPITGEIYVMSRDPGVDTENTPNVITVYSPLASGNAAPIRSITDTSTQFLSSLDIAFSPVTSSSSSVSSSAASSSSSSSAANILGYTIVSNSSVTFFVNSSPWVDIHYTVNGGGQLNVRMTHNSNNNNTYTLSGLSSGAVISYSFTVGRSVGGAYDTSWAQMTMPASSYGYTKVTSTSTQFYAKNAPWVDVHYTLNGANQQNVRMTHNADNSNTFTVTGIPVGTAVNYSFTIGQSVGAVDTAWTQFTQ